MCAFLQRCSFNLPKEDSRATGAREVSVVAAVVDGLCPPRPRGLPSSGLSVLYGQRDDILPGLWDDAAHHHSSSSSPDRQSASISVPLSPLLGDSRSLNVTLPLANTLFQNGRRSTLLASRWRTEGTGCPYELVAVAEKQSQTVVPAIRSIQTYTSVSVPLVPVTRPRKIVAGLGNIVRQVEIDDKPAPASKELEAAIPRLLEARSKRAPATAAVGPVAVWALVLPRQAMDLVSEDLAVSGDHDVSSEHEVAERVSRNFSQLLAAGCHLHRIRKSPTLLHSHLRTFTLKTRSATVSGGGGWGSKQGLLSLDPQTRYSVPGEDDINGFISSFYGEETAESIVTPGAYVQFLVEPLTYETGKTTSDTGCLPSLVFGTDSSASDGLLNVGNKPVEIEGDHFGAISHHGVFVESVSSSPHCIDSRGTTLTKIDTAYSYIWEGRKRWL